MFNPKLLAFLLCFFIDEISGIENGYASYLMQRQNIIAKERLMAFGANIILNEDEQRANDILMRHKHEELKLGVLLFTNWCTVIYRKFKFNCEDYFIEFFSQIKYSVKCLLKKLYGNSCFSTENSIQKSDKAIVSANSFTVFPSI